MPASKRLVNRFASRSRTAYRVLLSACHQLFDLRDLLRRFVREHAVAFRGDEHVVFDSHAEAAILVGDVFGVALRPARAR